MCHRAALAIAFALAMALQTMSAVAVETGRTAIDSTQVGRTGTAATTAANTQRETLLLAQASFWGLTLQEVEKANQLMQPGSPRAVFSSPTISPVEVLGIHAQTAAERERYAALFAKALHADTERVLAWAVTYGTVAKRLYPNEKIFDFGGRQIPKQDQIYLRH